jgi:hypothetical protein
MSTEDSSKQRKGTTPEKAWRTADFLYLRVLAATMVPLSGERPTREEMIDPLEEDLAYDLAVDRLLGEMDDVDAQILEEIYAGLFSFYGFLAEKGLVEQRTLDAFRSEAPAEKARLQAKLDMPPAR